jgi:hypothetical protein
MLIFNNLTNVLKYFYYFVLHSTVFISYLCNVFLFVLYSTIIIIDHENNSNY